MAVAEEDRDEEVSLAEFIGLVQNELQQALEFLSIEELRKISKVTPSPTFVTFSNVKLTVPVEIRAAIQPLPAEITKPSLILKKGFVIPKIEVSKEKTEESTKEAEKKKEKIEKSTTVAEKDEKVSIVPQYKLKVKTVGGPEKPPADSKISTLEISFVLVTKE